MLTPSGSVTDGNNGANYSVTFANDTTGEITAKPITVTAVTDTRVYDGTTGSVGVPMVSPGVAAGDTARFSQTYDTRNAGTGKALIPTGSVTDGNNGANYAVTFANDTTGEITAKPITVTAVTDTRVYDGTTSSVGVPTVSPGVAAGDTANFTQSYDTKNVGTAKTLAPAGSVADGNAGANYSMTFANDTTGVITTLTTATALLSSVNPSGPGTNVTFTATVNGVPPAADLPTGDVVFSANGTPFVTNALVSGSASAGTASLPLGTNAITADYVSDGNFQASTASLDQVVKTFVTCSQIKELLNIADNFDGTLTLTFMGTPQAEYYVVAGPDVAVAMSSWVALVGSTNTVTNVSGLWQFTVTNAPPKQFYRGAAVVPCP
jgi:hypothetical protein